MIKLKNVITELSEKNTLYHRSLKKMKVGDIIKPHMDKSGTHWLANIAFEIVLEQYRKEEHSDKPSRLNCIYSSVVPKSRFVDKGYLYVVKPIGKMFIANSNLIDIMADKFSRETIDFYDRKITLADIKANPSRFIAYLDYYTAEQYWKGDIQNIKSKINDIEILSESARIIEVIDEPNKLVAGNNVVVTESGKIYADLNLYLTEEMIDKYNQKTDDKFNQFIASVRDLFDGGNEKLDIYTFDKRSGSISIRGYLREKTKLKILFIESSGYRNYEYDGDRQDKQGKYKKILFGFYLKNKYYDKTKNKEVNGLPDYRMQYGDFFEYNKKDRELDISKFLKKVR